MAITLTISDANVTQTYDVFAIPIVSDPQHIETDVQTWDGNISTYFRATKQLLTLDLGYMTAAEYSVLKGFIQRQYDMLKYPVITIDGATNINVTNMTAKMTLNQQNVIDNCGTVEGVQVSFRESKQL